PLLTHKVPRRSYRVMRPPESRTSPLLLTNSNGEYRDGSSNKTPHIGVVVQTPPLVAQTMQQLRKLRLRNKKVGGRESIDTVPLARERFKGRQCRGTDFFMGRAGGPHSESRFVSTPATAELRSAWTLRLRSGQAREAPVPTQAKQFISCVRPGSELALSASPQTRRIRPIVCMLDRPGRRPCGLIPRFRTAPDRLSFPRLRPCPRFSPVARRSGSDRGRRPQSETPSQSTGRRYGGGKYRR